MLRTAEDAEQPFMFRILPGNMKTIGRAPRADFVVDAALVSRLHCRLTAGAGELEAVDLESTNGTYVNGERVERGTLKHGDRLRIGARRARGYEKLVAVRNGFVRRSWPIVVASPWPDYTTVSSGNDSSTSRIDRSSVARSPPGRSVRPIEPANSVSPTNSIALRLIVAPDLQTHAPGTMSRRVPDPDPIAAERAAGLPLVEEIDRRLGLRLAAEGMPLLHDGAVEKIVVLVQPDRDAEGRFGAADAGDVIEVRVGQQDVADLQRV